MPTYTYRCDCCGLERDIRRGFDQDESPVFCPDPDCDGRLHRIFAVPAVIYRGDGWYAKDHKEKPRDES